MRKKGFQITLNTLVELVLAVIAIIAVNIIIVSVLSVYTSHHQEKEFQIKGFKALYKKIGENEQLENPENEFGITTYLKKDLVIVGFSKNRKVLEGECSFPSVLKEGKFLQNVPALSYFSGDSIKLRAVKPDNCMDDKPYLCLCKQEFSDNKIDCGEASICLPYTEEYARNIHFTGYDKNPSCELPIIYAPEKSSVSNYCVHRHAGGLSFEPSSC